MVGRSSNQVGRKLLAAFMSLVLAVSMTPCVTQAALAAEGQADYIVSPALNYDAAVAVYGDYALMAKDIGADADNNKRVQYDVVNKDGQVTLSSICAYDEAAPWYDFPEEGDCFYDGDFINGYGYLAVGAASGTGTSWKYGLSKLSGEVVWDRVYDRVSTFRDDETGEVYAFAINNTNDDRVLVYLNLSTEFTKEFHSTMAWFTNVGACGNGYFSSGGLYFHVGSNFAEQVDIYETADYQAPDGTVFNVVCSVSSRESGTIGVCVNGNTTVLSNNCESYVTDLYVTDYRCADGLIAFKEETDSETCYKVYTYQGKLVASYDFGSYEQSSYSSTDLYDYRLLGNNRVLRWSEHATSNSVILDFDGNVVRDLDATGSGSLTFVDDYFAFDEMLPVDEDGDYVPDKAVLNVYDFDGNTQLSLEYKVVNYFSYAQLTSVGNGLYSVLQGNRAGYGYLVGGQYTSYVYDKSFNLIGSYDDATLESLPDNHYALSYYGSAVTEVLDENLKPIQIGGVSWKCSNNYVGLENLGCGAKLNSTASRSFANIRGYYAQDSSGKWGAVSADGKVIVPFEYDDYNDWNYSGYNEAPNSKYILVKKGAAWYFLDAEAAGEAVSASKVSRLAGQEADATSAAISAATYDKSDWVILARMDDFADAMSSTGLAGVLNAPIVLTDRNGLSESAAAEIKRLGAKNVYIIGGKGAMPGDFESELAALGVTNVDRIYGTEYYDTSVQCAYKLAWYKEQAGESNDRAIIAYGQNFQDALSVSSYAYKYHVPILLETTGETSAERALTNEAVQLLSEGTFANSSLYVPGGPGAVSYDSVERVFGDKLRGGYRIYGEDGYDTSNALATHFIGTGELSASTVCIATGAEAAKGVDALAGAALAGKNGGVMLLASAQNAMEAENYTTIDEGSDSQGNPSFLAANASSVKSCYIHGGAYVLPEAFQTKVDALLS